MRRINVDKYTNILSLASSTLKKISSNKEEWTNYLKTSSRLYKYPFDEQLLIYAQRPNATACASIEIWNSKMHSWIKRGSKGIALIDKNSDKPRLKYVFDLADIEKIKGIGKEPYLWTMQDEHKEVILKQLEKKHGHLEGNSLEDYIIELTKQIVNDNFQDYLDILIDIKENSFLEEIDTLNIKVMFSNILHL